MTLQEIRDILKQIEYRNWTFHVQAPPDGAMYLQLGWLDYDSFAGHTAEQKSRKWQLSSHMVKSEIVHTALKAVLTAEEHEARERFKYRGRRIFCPHFDVDSLVNLCDFGQLEYRRK